MVMVSQIAECAVLFIAIVRLYEQYIAYFAMLDLFLLYTW